MAFLNHQLTSRSLDETRLLGERIGNALTGSTMIGLIGTLGTGKTTLTQSIGRALEIPDGNVVSPTFTICVPHRGRLLLLHLDAYRIASPEEVDELGLDEQLEDGAVVLVEWSDRIEHYLPPWDLRIEIASTGEHTRVFALTSGSEKGDELIRNVSSDLQS